ncbi:STAS domain-containing protein [Modestobacter sp. SSW1-42]|uniref:STAS domain-containing protein n=1 Tax=Modestobacter sp. SSW1-42 TaxID=596372 RepID=UPI003987DFF3
MRPPPPRPDYLTGDHVGGALTVAGDVLTMTGEIDYDLTTRWQAEHDPTLLGIQTIDTSAVTFLGSSGLRLISQVTRATDLPVVLRGASPMTHAVLVISGLDRLLVLKD